MSNDDPYGLVSAPLFVGWARGPNGWRSEASDDDPVVHVHHCRPAGCAGLTVALAGCPAVHVHRCRTVEMSSVAVA